MFSCIIKYPNAIVYISYNYILRCVLSLSILFIHQDCSVPPVFFVSRSVRSLFTFIVNLSAVLKVYQPCGIHSVVCSGPARIGCSNPIQMSPTAFVYASIHAALNLTPTFCTKLKSLLFCYVHSLFRQPILHLLPLKKSCPQL